MENRITTLFGIRYPIIAGGMIWCSGWRLAAAVSDAGGLGLIGAGSMTPDLLREHIRKCRAATGKPFGVNVPLMYRYAEEIMGVIMEERVPAVFTSAGSPKTWTARLHEAGCKVAHVISSTKFALKSQQAGVDAVVAEGFEAGGHKMILANSSYKSGSDEQNNQLSEMIDIVKKYDPNGVITGEGAMTKDLIEVADVDFNNVNITSIIVVFVIIAIVFRSASSPNVCSTSSVRRAITSSESP